jgi:PAS domain S-box-containing protein
MILSKAFVPVKQPENRMFPVSRSVDRFLAPKVLLVGFICYFSTEIGFAFKFPPHYISPLWPTGAILFSVLVMSPTRHWWAYTLAAYFTSIVNDASAGFPISAIFFIAAGMIEIFIAAVGVRCFAAGLHAFESLRSLVAYIIVAVVLAPFISAFVAAFAGTVETYWFYWRVWFLSEALAYLMLAPAILTWIAARSAFKSISFARCIEACLIGFGLLAISVRVFTWPATDESVPPLVYLPLPFLIWVAVRFGPTGVNTSLFVVAFLSIVGAVRGNGPFIAITPADSVLPLQLFLVTISVPLMLLAALIHERRDKEEALRESEERVALAASAGELGLWERNLERGDLWANPRLRSLLGFGQNDVLRFEELIARIHPEDRARVIAEVERAQQAGVSFDGEFRVVIPDGGERWVAARGRTVDGRNGARSMGVVFDVTERKRAERDLNAALVEIRGLKERLEEENIYLKEEISEVKGFEEIVGKSDALKYVLTRVEQVAKTDATVLLQGETGVGKELVAGAIHERSSRSNGPYVKVNCATLPEALVESELFGHEKGAFTGADRQRKGRFELADLGTILLDEVGELPLGTQAKLLRVLEEGEFERVGGSSTLKVKVRVIAATNRKLHEEVSAGRFRQDLFYRLNVYPITIPPLRQRREDIPLLVVYYVRQIGERLGKSIREVPAQAMRELAEYDWPGNIRELQNVIERAVIVSTDAVLRLPEPLAQATTETTGGNGAFKEPMTISTLDEAEREHILRALEATGWRIEGPKGAAAMLKLHPSTLRFRMKKLGLTKVLSYTPQAQKRNLH